MYDPVVVAPVICTCFVLIVVFATIAYFKASSRRMQGDGTGLDDDGLGQRKAETLSMNTLRMKGMAGHTIVCVAGDEASDMILTPEADGGCYDGECARCGLGMS